MIVKFENCYLGQNIYKKLGLIPLVNNLKNYIHSVTIVNNNSNNSVLIDDKCYFGCKYFPALKKTTILSNKFDLVQLMSDNEMSKGNDKQTFNYPIRRLCKHETFVNVSILSSY